MKFFTYNQNNSGGDFWYDEKRGISTFVIIEAESASKADARAEEIGLYWDGVGSGTDCDCCGDRWHPKYDGGGDAIPSVYGVPVHFLTVKNELSRWQSGYECFVHYADGRIIGFYK